jgi:hypothetical protein
MNADYEGSYCVASLWTWTDLKCLWKILSRPINKLEEAVFEAEHHASLPKNKNKKVFVVKVIHLTSYKD